MEETISVLGENILVRDVDSAPEKQGSFYVPPTSYAQVKSGVIVDLRVLTEGYEFLKIGSSIFYEVNGVRIINSKGIEFKVVPLKNVLAVTDGKDNESN